MEFRWTCGVCRKQAIGIGDALPSGWVRNYFGTAIACSLACLMDGNALYTMRVPDRREEG